MKKFMLLMVMIAGLLSFTQKAHAQSATLMQLSAGDTISTTTSLDTVSKVITATAGYSALGIQVVGTKVSGTITQKAYLYSSLDGSAYVLTDSATAFANSAGAQSVWFTKTAGLPYTYYKVQVRNIGASTSTESMIVRVYYVLKGFK
jgi:hypothetical protein